MPRDRDGEMREATLLHVRTPVPPGQLGALPEVALRIVAGAGPELDDAEGQKRDCAHVVRGRDLARPFPPRNGSSSGRTSLTAVP